MTLHRIYVITQNPKPKHWRVGQQQRDRSEHVTALYKTLEFLFPAYETTASHPHLALFTCLFLLMSLLGVAVYCTDRRRPQRLCEELEAALAVYLLHMKQLLWGCWIWLTMQWFIPTTRRAWFIDLPFFSLLWKKPRPPKKKTLQSPIWRGTAHCLQCWSTLRVKKGKSCNPRSM